MPYSQVSEQAKNALAYFAAALNELDMLKYFLRLLHIWLIS